MAQKEGGQILMEDVYVLHFLVANIVLWSFLSILFTIDFCAGSTTAANFVLILLFFISVKCLMLFVLRKRNGQASCPKKCNFHLLEVESMIFAFPYVSVTP